MRTKPDLSTLHARRIRGPSLSEMLDDPIVQAVMRRDGVTRDDMETLIRTARSKRLVASAENHRARTLVLAVVKWIREHAAQLMWDPFFWGSRTARTAIRGISPSSQSSMLNEPVLPIGIPSMVPIESYRRDERLRRS